MLVAKHCLKSGKQDLMNKSELEIVYPPQFLTMNKSTTATQSYPGHIFVAGQVVCKNLGGWKLFLNSLTLVKKN